GGRCLAARRRDDAARPLRRLHRRAAEAPDRAAADPGRPAREAQRPVRASGGASRMKLKLAFEVLGLLALAALIAVMPRFVSSYTAYELATVGMYFIALLGLSILIGY